MRAGWWLLVELSGLGITMVPARTVRGQMPASGALPVPYLAQSELLCGGAAVAMIERWWGRRQVFAEEFAHLVRRDEGGIRTTDLADATRRRGWHVEVRAGDPAMVQEALEDSIPVLALIEVSRDRYHYVVILAWNDSVVTFHDPAVTPRATMDRAEFGERWDATDRWSMLVRPLAGGGMLPGPAPREAVLPCEPWLRRAAEAAGRGAHREAESALDSAAVRCPLEPLVRRERAGLRFREGEHRQAAELITSYLAHAPHDSLAWQLLAAARYVRGDRAGALEAWNAIGWPLLDLFRVSGSASVRFHVVTAATGLRLGAVLLGPDLLLAQRRVSDIPAVNKARVDYRPIPGGFAEVDIAVVESPRWPAPPRLAIGAARAAFGGVAELEIGSLAGAGEAWDVAWRWRSANPEVALRLDAPLTLGVPGVAGLRREWEEWRFESGEPDRRRHATTIDFRNWWTATVETRFAIRHEWWRDEGEAVALGIGFGLHDRGDRFGVVLQGERAIGVGDRDGYRRATLDAGYRSGPDHRQPVLEIRLGYHWSGDGAPLGLRPIAGGDAGRAVPLRAHRWDTDDRLSLRRLGRAILHGGLALDRDVARLGPFTVGAGAFLDLALVHDPVLAAAEDAGYADAGIGLRVGLPGGGGSTLRVDLARGLAAEPRWGVSVGLARSWPLRADGID